MADIKNLDGQWVDYLSSLDQVGGLNVSLFSSGSITSGAATMPFPYTGGGASDPLPFVSAPANTINFLPDWMILAASANTPNTRPPHFEPFRDITVFLMDGGVSSPTARVANFSQLSDGSPTYNILVDQSSAYVNVDGSFRLPVYSPSMNYIFYAFKEG